MEQSVIIAEHDAEVGAIIISHPSELRAKRQEIWALIEAEMKRAKKKYPSFPVHAAAKAGVVVKQSGSLMAHSMNVKYNRGDGFILEKANIKKSAIKTIVAAMRLLESL